MVFEVLRAAVLAVLMSFPPAVADREETYDARAARMRELSTDIAHAALETRWRGDRRDLAALLVSIAWHETRIARVYQRGERKGMGGARGLWQIEKGANSKGDPLLASTAAEHLSRSWQCGGHPAGWFTAYAGAKCGREWPTLRARVRTFYWVRGRLS